MFTIKYRNKFEIRNYMNKLCEIYKWTTNLWNSFQKLVKVFIMKCHFIIVIITLLSSSFIILEHYVFFMVVFSPLTHFHMTFYLSLSMTEETQTLPSQRVSAPHCYIITFLNMVNVLANCCFFFSADIEQQKHSLVIFLASWPMLVQFSLSFSSGFVLHQLLREISAF